VSLHDGRTFVIGSTRTDGKTSLAAAQKEGMANSQFCLWRVPSYYCVVDEADAAAATPLIFCPLIAIIMTSRISQELFDETVLENQDVFELSEEEALQETLSQYSLLDLNHLVLSHPFQDLEAREERKQFVEAMNKLDKCVQEDGSVIIQPECVEWLEIVQKCCESNPKAYLVLLHQQEGMYTLLSFFTDKNHMDREALVQTIQTIITILTPTSLRLDVQSQLRDMMGATTMTPWMTLFCTTVASETSDEELQSLLLQMAYVSCRQNEDNKKQWMKAAMNNEEANGIDVLLNLLKQQDTTLVIQACHLLTTLCRFDDFRVNHTNTPVVSSAHDNVLEFSRHNAVPLLFAVAQDYTNDTPLLTATLSALRVLAIHDDIVQSMVAIGVLDLVQSTLFEQHQDVCAATLGLIRNLSANDAVKTTLCNDAVLSGLLYAMQTHQTHAALQEHACGTLAAMALRKPQNALKIVQTHDGHSYILAAMRNHSNNKLVQRQGALALRNIASRSTPQDGICQAMLDAGAEQVLRQAGQEQSCVDEAYAALRDLGCNVKVMKLDKESGKAVERTSMFGDSKPNFRPVLEESSNAAAKHD